MRALAIHDGFFLLPGATKTAPKLGGVIKLSLPAATPCGQAVLRFNLHGVRCSEAGFGLEL